jgi:DNA helicase HerA-like ATPase
MLVSQKISDFDPAMRSAMNISILFRTKYDGDLKAVARMLGSEISTIIPKLSVGYSTFHLADIGEPFVIARARSRTDRHRTCMHGGLGRRCT